MIPRLLAIAVVALLASCHINLAESSGVADLDMRGWSSTAQVPLMNSDTLLRRDVKLFLRYEMGQNEGDTLRFRVLRRSPLFRFREDTVQMIIPQDNRPLGSGYAVATAPYLDDVASMESGVYLYYITPLEEYYHCSAIGVRTEFIDSKIRDGKR